MNKKILLAKIKGLDLKYRRSLHKPYCDANTSPYLTISSWSGCFGCIRRKEQSQ